MTNTKNKTNLGKKLAIVVIGIVVIIFAALFLYTNDYYRKVIIVMIIHNKIWQDGVFQVGKNKFSNCYRFPDINYAVASRADKEAMFLEYSELLNFFDSGTTTKITIALRRINRKDFEKEILLPYKI